jgi:hypothetical protein
LTDRCSMPQPDAEGGSTAKKSIVQRATRVCLALTLWLAVLPTAASISIAHSFPGGAPSNGLLFLLGLASAWALPACAVVYWRRRDAAALALGALGAALPTTAALGVVTHPAFHAHLGRSHVEEFVAAHRPEIERCLARVGHWYEVKLRWRTRHAPRLWWRKPELERSVVEVPGLGPVEAPESWLRVTTVASSSGRRARVTLMQIGDDLWYARWREH